MQRNIHIDDETWQKLKDFSIEDTQRLGLPVSRSDIIRILIRDYIQERENGNHTV